VERHGGAGEATSHGEMAGAVEGTRSMRKAPPACSAAKTGAPRQRQIVNSKRASFLGELAGRGITTFDAHLDCISRPGGAASYIFKTGEKLFFVIAKTWGQIHGYSPGGPSEDGPKAS
jgi:hypothetical protein